MAEGGRRQASRGGKPRSGPRITFVADETGYRSVGVSGRSWSVLRVITGWRLEFRDPGDDAPTYAGMFGTAERAMQEANRDPSRPGVKRG
jgi:hypothetical protein